MKYDRDFLENDVDAKEFEEFLEKIREIELKNDDAKIIPEVFGIQYKEVYITKWIAYLLRQSYGFEILNALLSASNRDIIINKDEIEKIYTEYVFDTGRRIDILIFTNNYLIGIENKIWSGEQESQTADYLDSMKKLSDTKDYIGIYLHPEQNQSESSSFENVTYTQLYNKIEAINISDSKPFEWMMLEQFKIYVKEYLYMSNGEFPEITQNTILYAKNIGLIQNLQSEYDNVSSKVIEWLKYKFEDSGYKVLNESCRGYMQLALCDSKELWENIGFHFEILWTNDFMINSNLRIEVHLEKVKGGDKRLQEIFELENDNNRGDKNPLERKLLTGCSFETEEKAEDTFKRILDVLGSDTFKELADKANTLMPL